MERGITAAACLVLLALQGQAAEPRVNVVAEGIRGISTGEAGGSVLVVFVMDDAGDPIDEVTVVVTDGGRAVESGKTDARGRVVFQFPTERVVGVRAEDAGLVPSVANGVVLRKGGLTGLALPLEEAVRREPPVGAGRGR